MPYDALTVGLIAGAFALGANHGSLAGDWHDGSNGIHHVRTIGALDSTPWYWQGVKNFSINVIVKGNWQDCVSPEGNSNLPSTEYVQDELATRLVKAVNETINKNNQYVVSKDNIERGFDGFTYSFVYNFFYNKEFDRCLIFKSKGGIVLATHYRGRRKSERVSQVITNDVIPWPIFLSGSHRLDTMLEKLSDLNEWGDPYLTHSDFSKRREPQYSEAPQVRDFLSSDVNDADFFENISENILKRYRGGVLEVGYGFRSWNNSLTKCFNPPGERKKGIAQPIVNEFMDFVERKLHDRLEGVYKVESRRFPKQGTRSIPISLNWNFYLRELQGDKCFVFVVPSFNARYQIRHLEFKSGSLDLIDRIRLDDPAGIIYFWFDKGNVKEFKKRMNDARHEFNDWFENLQILK